MREYDISSADGTRIRTWHTDGSGPDVLLCPGLGTTPEAWPLLVGPGAGVRAHSWYHRGTLGSARPADPARIGLADQVGDALAVLDNAGIERAVLIGSSVGVTVAMGLAGRYPDRVAGLLLVAGTPGDPFGGVLGVLGVPVAARRRLAHAVTRAVADAGPLVNAVLHRVPVNQLTAGLVRHSGLMRPASRTEDVVRAGRRFLRHDWGWYAQLALAMAADQPVDLAGVRCPVTLLTGRYDVLTDPRHAARAIGQLPQARLRMLPTSHFLLMEAPEALAAELSLLIDRADAVVAAARWTGRATWTAPAPRAAPVVETTLTRHSHQAT